MKVVYIAHPLGHGANREMNRIMAAKWVAWAADQGVAPIADWIILSGEWTEDRRDDGLAVDKALVERCDEVWLCGPRVSPGMKVEAEHARLRGIRVVNKTGSVEPPDLACRACYPHPSHRPNECEAKCGCEFCPTCSSNKRAGFVLGKCPPDAQCLACDRHGSHYEPCPGCGGEAT